MIVREEHTVSTLKENTRCVDYCIGLFPQLQTRNSVKKAIKNRVLYHNDEVATTGTWVEVGDTLRLIDDESRVPKAFNLSIPIEFEDEYLAIVRKPAGLVVSGNQYRTLENALVGQLKASKQADRLNWGRPVHRLDAATSGLVIIAKTAAAHRKLAKSFEERRIEKQYHAIVVGKPEGEMELSEPINGQSAISTLKSLKVVQSLQNEYLSLVKLSPRTGRTHQLRIHCAGQGHPIVGDVLYGEKGNTLLHKGLFLSATKLEFIHPITEKSVCIEITPPDKFHSFLEREERRYKKFKSD